MAIVEITAHAALSFASAEAEVLAWLDSQGLEVSFGEETHLIAFPQDVDATDGEAPVAEVDLYPLDGGVATQVRWRLRGEALIEALIVHLAETSQWTTDGRWTHDQLQGER